MFTIRFKDLKEDTEVAWDPHVGSSINEGPLLQKPSHLLWRGGTKELTGGSQLRILGYVQAHRRQVRNIVGAQTLQSFKSQQ